MNIGTFSLLRRLFFLRRLSPGKQNWQNSSLERRDRTRGQTDRQTDRQGRNGLILEAGWIKKRKESPVIQKGGKRKCRNWKTEKTNVRGRLIDPSITNLFRSGR